MTINEFSYLFDVMLRSFALAGTLVLDEYEKSVYLTMAQESLIKEKYNNNFEQDEELREILKPLIATANGNLVLPTNGSGQLYFDKYKTSYWMLYISNLWWVVHEQVTLYDECLAECYNGKIADVKVVRVDELNTIIKNPFLRPNESRVLRIDHGGNNNNPTYELISKYTIDSYRVRYIRQPKPIILLNLPDNLTIYGQKTALTSELNTSTHGEILARAVLLAISSNIANASPAPDQEEEKGE